ncbi:hypothetical protein M426DRAFT_12652 [Hypoxylon sp. CI-4A]|nr:hypothetical protein M426DRAFT_12652 [Hypoxylon sp. CI-4A]
MYKNPVATSSQPGLQVPFYDSPEVYREQQDPLYTVESQDPQHIFQQSNEQSVPLPQDKSESRRAAIRGLPVRYFWLIAAIVASTLLLAIVGGTVGGVLASRNSQKTSNDVSTSPASSSNNSNGSITTTTSPPASSTTSSSPIPFPTSGLLSLDCPSINATTTKTVNLAKTNYTFQYYCWSDITPENMLIMNSSTVDDCVTQCAEYNQSGGTSDCGGVVWNGNLTSALQRGGNCYLKGSGMEAAPCSNCPIAAAALLKDTSIAS